MILQRKSVHVWVDIEKETGTLQRARICVPNRVSAFRPTRDLERALVSSQQLRAATVSQPARKSVLLKVESDLSCQRSRSYIVRAAERGEEVVKGVLVGDVDGRQVEVHLVVVGAEQVLLANREV